MGCVNRISFFGHSIQGCKTELYPTTTSNVKIFKVVDPLKKLFLPISVGGGSGVAGGRGEGGGVPGPALHVTTPECAC